MPVPYDSRDVAAYLVQLCDKRQIFFNKSKIHKLVFCCYGTYLAITGEHLCDEYPRAWKSGPTFPKILKAFAEGLKIAKTSHVLEKEHPNRATIIIQKTLENFGSYDVTELAEWLCQKGSPWDKTFHSMGQLLQFIPDSFISNYFKTHVLDESDYSLGKWL